MAAEKLQSFVPVNSTFVMIFSDSGERYLETIYNDSWVESNFDKIQKLVPKDSGRNVEYTSMPAMVNNNLRTGNGAVQHHS